MSQTKEYLADAIEAWTSDGTPISNGVALYLIEQHGMIDLTRGGVRRLRDGYLGPNAKLARDEADAVFGWMVENKVRQITAEIYDHLRAEYARAQNARAEAAGNVASLTLPDVTIDTCMSDAASERTLAIQIDTQHRVAVHLNDGLLYEGDPNVDGVIPVPQELMERLVREYPPAQPRSSVLDELFAIYKEVTGS